MNKKGLSPVIATVLLIAIVVILALIIFLWARSFFQEQTLKFEEPIENACPRVNFEAEAYKSGQGASTTVDVINRGNVPIHGFQVNLRTDTSSLDKGYHLNQNAQGVDDVLKNGETGSFVIPIIVQGNEDLELIPGLLGLNGEIESTHICDDEYSQIIAVS